MLFRLLGDMPLTTLQGAALTTQFSVLIIPRFPLTLISPT